LKIIPVEQFFIPIAILLLWFNCKLYASVKNEAMTDKLKSLLSEIIPALLIFLFVYAAISKLANHNQFIYVLSKSPLIGQFTALISWIVPVVELLISLLLFRPGWRRFGLSMSMLLMSAFTLYIGYMLLFTPQLPCSCGGIIQQLSWREHLLFNILFTVLAYMGFRFTKQSKVFIAINRLEAENPAKKR
jgi:hypothetical protein